MSGASGAAMILGAMSTPAYACDAAVFDGTNDYQARGADLDGNADGTKGLISLWFRLAGGNGALMGLYDTNNSWMHIHRTAGNKIDVRVYDSGGTLGFTFVSTTSYTAGATWYNLIASWDLSASAGAAYINDATDGAPTISNRTVDYTRTDHFIGAADAGANKGNVELADVYMNFAQYLDLSNSTNRRKFISGSGKPVSLGATGTLPTGSAPIMLFHLDDGEAAANFATNRGTGGNFTVTGALTTATTSPSD